MIPSKIPELNVKVCYHKITTECPEVLQYLPDPYGKKLQLPDNEFFWKILYSIAFKSVVQFVDDTLAERKKR